MDIRDKTKEQVQEHAFGCSDPVRVAQLKPGEKVLDLGCGIGFNLMIAAKAVGGNGHAYGLDRDALMLKKARININRLRIANATLFYGDIKTIPLFDEGVDVVLFNGSLHLSHDKDRVLHEVYRILVPGGRFVVSHFVLLAPLPDELRIKPAPNSWINGALPIEEYREKLIHAGFTDVTITLTKQNALDVDAIKKRLSLQENESKALDAVSANALIQAYKPR